MDFLEEQLAKTNELPPDILISVLKRIKQDATQIMKSISQVKVTLPINYEKRALVILAAQKLISSTDQHTDQQARDLPPIEKERAGDKKNTATVDDGIRKSNTIPKQPVNQAILTILEDEDEEIGHDSEDVQSKTTPSLLPALLLANETHGPNQNTCFVNSPVQLLRHIPTFRLARFP